MCSYLAAFNMSPTTLVQGMCSKAPILFHFFENLCWWLGSSHDGEGVWGREMHQQVQHNENSTLHTLTPPDNLIRGLVKAIKVASNEKYEIFPRKIGALMCSGRHVASHAVVPHEP